MSYLKTETEKIKKNTLSIWQAYVLPIIIELRYLRHFIAASEEKNISRASKRLHISQQAVSRQIKNLEEELEVPLFKRLRDGLELTDTGKTALVYAREVLRQAVVMDKAMEPFREKILSLYWPSVISQPCCRVFSPTSSVSDYQVCCGLLSRAILQRG